MRSATSSACLALAWVLTAGMASAQQVAPPPADGGKEKGLDPMMTRTLDAVETATSKIRSLNAAYTRSFTRFGSSKTFKEEGTLLWKRTAEGTISARWEGKDPDGDLLTLVRGREMTVWRAKKKEKALSLDDPKVLHASALSFPLLPRDCRTTFDIGGPITSPEYDGRSSWQLTGGIPTCLTFTPRKGGKLFAMLSLVFDPETGLAQRYRYETDGWEQVTLDLYDWKLNPEIPDASFAPPVQEKAGSGDRPTAEKGGAREK